MKHHTVPRFAVIEIAWHWVQAVPYLVLIVTGVLILAQRLMGAEWVPHAGLALAHRVAGLALVGLLAVLLAGAIATRRTRHLWRTLRDAFLWRPRNLVWLVKIPLHALLPHVKLPPAGRLNPGQKLHTLAIATIVPGFVATGVAMMLVPTALGPWVLHAALLVPACAYLGVHLFLSLINPPTRRALTGIFLGHVPADYAAAHHPLWVGEPEPAAARHALVSRWVLVGTAAAIVAAAGVAVWRYGPDKLQARVAALRQSGGWDLLRPGDLIAAHAEKLGNGRCLECHRMFAQAPSEACLPCHEDIRRAAAERIGFHGKLTGECRTCHADHLGADADILSLDRETFNHSLTRFAHTGKHADAACDECHKRPATPSAPAHMQFVGLRFAACTDCHDNPHGSSKAADCTRCHTLDGWKGRNLFFDHNRDTKFQLIGKHPRVRCSKCHEAKEGGVMIFTGASAKCDKCHKNPHPDALGDDCTRCHFPLGWRGRYLLFEHNRDSKYRLTGGHAGVDCAKCHVPTGKHLASARMTGLDTRCAACHKDPHAGQFEKTCEQCHGVEGWKGSPVKFSHDRDADFKIDATHRSLACDACHARGKAVTYRPLPKTCEGCHKRADAAFWGTAAQPPEPDAHAGRMMCTECHPPNAPARSLGDYATDCANCHEPRYEGLLYDWAKSLHEREARAAALLESLSARDDPRVADVARKIAEARAVGLHNVQLTPRLWDELLGPPSGKPPAERTDSKEPAERP